MSPLAHLLALPIRGYRLLLSPWVGHGCRFQPTCSAYALEALEKHGALRGGRLALWRILRCNPWGGSGIDNVPEPAGRHPAGQHVKTRSDAACRSSRVEEAPPTEDAPHAERGHAEYGNGGR